MDSCPYKYEIVEMKDIVSMSKFSNSLSLEVINLLEERLNLNKPLDDLTLGLKNGELTLCNDCDRIILKLDGEFIFKFCDGSSLHWKYEPLIDAMVLTNKLPFVFGDSVGEALNALEIIGELFDVDPHIIEVDP
jgi:hypothetical protein